MIDLTSKCLRSQVSQDRVSQDQVSQDRRQACEARGAWVTSRGKLG